MNSKTTTQTQKKPPKPVFFNVNMSPSGVHYMAKYGDLEISGNTTDRVFYEETVSRIVSAAKELPAEVRKMAEFLANHVATAITTFGSTYVSTSMETEVACCTKLMLHISLIYLPDEGIWRGGIEATFDGRDGRDSEGNHMVKKRIEVNDIDAETLKREIIRVARHAYNAYGRE
jgi:hypothetical protein